MAPTPLQVKYYAPDEQSDDWDENGQPDGHRNLLPEVFSAYASQTSLRGMSVVSIICTVNKFLKVAAADEVPFVRYDGTVVIAQRALWGPYVDQQD